MDILTINQGKVMIYRAWSKTNCANKEWSIAVANLQRSSEVKVHNFPMIFGDRSAWTADLLA